MDHQWLIDRRIACYEGGYPECEAAFSDVKEYVEYLEELVDAAIKEKAAKPNWMNK